MQVEDRKHCRDHVEAQERIARIEALVEVHTTELHRMEIMGASQAQTLKEISVCTEKLSKQLDTVAGKMMDFEQRWNRKVAETDLVIAEYRQAMIAINQRFEEGDRRLQIMEDINNNFAWFREMVNRGRAKIIEGFIFVAMLALLLTITMQWQDIASRLMKWLGR